VRLPGLKPVFSSPSALSTKYSFILLCINFLKTFPGNTLWANASVIFAVLLRQPDVINRLLQVMQCSIGL